MLIPFTLSDRIDIVRARPAGRQVPLVIGSQKPGAAPSRRPGARRAPRFRVAGPRGTGRRHRSAAPRVAGARPRVSGGPWSRERHGPRRPRRADRRAWATAVSQARLTAIVVPARSVLAAQVDQQRVGVMFHSQPVLGVAVLVQRAVAAETGDERCPPCHRRRFSQLASTASADPDPDPGRGRGTASAPSCQRHRHHGMRDRGRHGPARRTRRRAPSTSSEDELRRSTAAARRRTRSPASADSRARVPTPATQRDRRRPPGEPPSHAGRDREAARSPGTR